MPEDVAELYRRAGWWTGRRLIDRFESHVAAGPHEIALVSGGDTLTRAELWRLAGEAAEQLRDVVGPGRRVVVIHMPNLTAWVVMFLAVLRVGQVPATPPVTTPEAHLRHIFDLIQPALVLCARRNRRASPDETIRRAASGAATQVAWLSRTEPR